MHSSNTSSTNMDKARALSLSYVTKFLKKGRVCSDELLGMMIESADIPEWDDDCSDHLDAIAEEFLEIGLLYRYKDWDSYKKTVLDNGLMSFEEYRYVKGTLESNGIKIAREKGLTTEHCCVYRDTEFPIDNRGFFVKPPSEEDGECYPGDSKPYPFMSRNELDQQLDDYRRHDPRNKA